MVEVNFFFVNEKDSFIFLIVFERFDLVFFNVLFENSYNYICFVYF